MTTCLTIAADDPAYRAALAHPKSTPAVRRRVLQRLAASFRGQAQELKLCWEELRPADHDWWIAWANDELPQASPAEWFFGVLFGFFTVFNIIVRRDDALEFLTAARALRATVIDLRSKEVWDAALGDPDFVSASERGFADLAAGRATKVALKDL